MSTHGPQYDEFKARSGEQHGGAEYDEGFRPAEGSDPRNEQTPGHTRVGSHGPLWDEFPWQDMPGKHGQLFDTDFATKSAMGGEHGTWHDVFRGAKVKFVKGGRDMEGMVLNTESDHAVVESTDGARHEIGLGQILGFKNVPGSKATPDRQEAARGNGAAPGADAARSGALTTEHGSGPLPAAPSHGPSSTANAGHLRKATDSEILDVLKGLAEGDTPSPFDRAVAEHATDVHKAFADSYGEAHAAALKHTRRALKAAEAGQHSEAWTHHDRAMSWHAKAYMMKTQAGVQSQLGRVGKTADVEKMSVGATFTANKPCGIDGCTGTSFRAGAPKQAAGRSTALATCTTCHAEHKISNLQAPVRKTVDSSETAAQSQDLESKTTVTDTGKHWCPNCKHFCRHGADGKCPTCGHKTMVKKAQADDADVLQTLTTLAQEG